MKFCNSCDTEKPLSDFYRRGKIHQHKCKQCEKTYKAINSDRQKLSKRKHYLSNIEKFKQRTREYRRQNRERRKQTDKIYFSNPVNRLVHNMRIRIREVLVNKNTKAETTMGLVGCERDVLMKHIESKFRNGMAWSNYGKIWSIDHIIPCAKFDFSKPEDQKQCFHYTNLQPLTCSENSSKQHRILKPTQTFMPL